MAIPESEQWNLHTRHTLKRYEEALLRQVAHKLCKPRGQWPMHELLDRIASAVTNTPMIDRRLKELPVESRRIMCVIARSRVARWPVGSLIEMLVALGAKDGLAALVNLLESGLLLPELFPLGSDPDAGKTASRARLKSFAAWLTRSDPMPMVLASPLVTNRAFKEDLGIACIEVQAEGSTIHEADGLDWPLRVAVLWQQANGAPLRRTQQGGFFKRDHDRLVGDPILGSPPTDALTPIPDPGLFTAALAFATGLLHEQETELHAGAWTPAWKAPLPTLLVHLWTALGRIVSWNPAQGNAPSDLPGSPYTSAYLLAILYLAQMPEKSWASPADVETWIALRHPYWLGKKTDSLGIATFLLGIAYSLRLLQATKAPDGGWLVRLAPLGRWALCYSDEPPAVPSFKHTLLVQPNLEILAYRQGLTPELIASLSRIGTWKTLGAACTLQLEPHSIYRALEMGDTLTSIVQLLEGHGTKALPGAVLDSLKTWSSKRERIGVYSAGAIFEFTSPTEMNEAIARGLPAVRLTDRLAIVANEKDIEYKHFRLTGTRDYNLPPEKCVDVEPDGVTLSVDLGRSDLLLETELQRFAEPVAAHPSGDGPGAKGNRTFYRITPGSILSARQHGVALSYLETWFGQRTGMPITAAGWLLVTGSEAGPVELRRQLVVHVANEHLADGLQQWPGTRPLIRARLGPTTLVVDEADVPVFAEHLKEIGVKVLFEA